MNKSFSTSPSSILAPPHSTPLMEPPPYREARYTVAMILRQYSIVLRILLASYRSDWLLHIFAGIILPVGMIIFIKAVNGVATAQQAIYLLGGTITMSIAFGPVNFLINRVSAAKEGREFHYWITLPLPKLVLVLAIITVSLLFAIPGIIGTYLLGALFLQLSFEGAWLLLLLLPLGILPLAGVGTLIGSLAANTQIANLISNFLFIFVGFLSPMMIPSDTLPLPLRVLSWGVPTTYVADAFRVAIANTMGSALMVDGGILILFSLASLLLAHKKMAWRVA